MIGVLRGEWESKEQRTTCFFLILVVLSAFGYFFFFPVRRCTGGRNEEEEGKEGERKRVYIHFFLRGGNYYIHEHRGGKGSCPRSRTIESGQLFFFQITN